MGVRAVRSGGSATGAERPAFSRWSINCDLQFRVVVTAGRALASALASALAPRVSVGTARASCCSSPLMMMPRRRFQSASLTKPSNYNVFPLVVTLYCQNLGVLELDTLARLFLVRKFNNNHVCAKIISRVPKK